MELPLHQEIFSLMDKLQKNYLQTGLNSGLNYFDQTESQHFRAIFQQNIINGKLIEGKTLFMGGSTASLSPDMMFRLSIFPNGNSNVAPLRIEVDCKNISGNSKIIHINSAQGNHFNIPEKDIRTCNPLFPIDFVGISGTNLFRKAMEASINHWQLY